MVGERAAPPPAYVPARDLSLVTAGQLLGVVRAAGEARYLTPAQLAVPVEIERVLLGLEHACSETLGALTLEDLAARSDEASTRRGAGEFK